MHRALSRWLNRPLVIVAFLVAAALASSAVAVAEPLGSIPNPRVRDGTWVTDLPGALRPDTIAWLNATLRELEQQTGAEMAVVVVRSLDGLSIEEAAVKLFALWGIGKKGTDNGLLLLWSTGDRRVRVEVGYGLEGVLPDGKVGAILDSYVIPQFKSGDFDAGIVAGVDVILKAVRNEPINLASADSESYESGSSPFTGWLMGVLTAVPAGIGSLVGFRRWRRYRKRKCPKCQASMIRLDETDDDALLQPGQQTEERIASVDYDVWKCPVCAHHFIVRYARWLSSYDTCPQCHNRTKSSKQTTIEAATTSSSGLARVDERCEFCSFTNEYTKVLPRIVQSSSSSSSGSSSSSSSSFGGGSSGGGGASRGY